MKNKLLLIVVYFFTLTNLSSQITFQSPHYSVYGADRHHCGTVLKQALTYEKWPHIYDQRRDVERHAASWHQAHLMQLSNRLDSHMYEIPIVVHVVYANAIQNISEAQILSQIQILNQDFTKTNPDISSVPFVFSFVTADVGFTFCLATTDPNGQPTNGINRVQTSVANIGDVSDGNIYYSAQGGVDAWDEDKYLNIWVCEIDSNGSLLGYATPPGTAAAGEDGIVMDYKYFGTEGTVQAPYNGGRTLTHEVGHYFDLEHIWGDGDCTVDDGIFDTPTQESPYGGCPSFPQSSCGTDDMFMNFMDYVNDDCMFMFTDGQKTKMVNALNASRSGLVTNNPACELTSIEVLNRSLKIFPNPTSGVIDWQFDQKISQIQLYDGRGALVRSWLRDLPTSLDIRSHNNGLYHLVFQSNRGQIIKRIIKMD